MTEMMNKYPIYIISKGRWKSRLTSKSLEEMNQPYRIVVEPKEYNLYADVISKEKIISLPDNFSEFGEGSIPARNFVWEHSIKEGHLRHWILDDNIEQFNRLNNNLQVKLITPIFFKISEDFVDRYENVALSGFQYDFFAKSKTKLPPFYLNTRIYSTILIKNDIPYRWRGKYNEDTDLSIRALKDGYCTILFYAFLQQKAQTMKMIGGNTDTIYNTNDNRFEFAKSISEQHPDVARISKKFGRFHHHINYKPFKKNKLIRKENIEIKNEVNNYGMFLKKI
jgi:hypothetical protein